MSISLELLCMADPRMEDLRRECEEIAVSTGYNIEVARELWYGSFIDQGIKARMSKLVGSFAEVPELADRGAYCVAYIGLWRELTGRELK